MLVDCVLFCFVLNDVVENDWCVLDQILLHQVLDTISTNSIAWPLLPQLGSTLCPAPSYPI